MRSTLRFRCRGGIKKRRTVFPCGKPTTLDLEMYPVRFRVPTGMHGEGNIKTLSMVHSTVVDLTGEACKEGDRAAMLMNFSGKPGRVHRSRSTAAILRDAGYGLEERGMLQLKGLPCPTRKPTGCRPFLRPHAN